MIKKLNKYVFAGEGKVYSAEEMIDYYEELLTEFPIVSIEDPLDEEDWEGWEQHDKTWAGHSTRWGRFICHKYTETGKRDQAAYSKRHFNKGESDRNTYGGGKSGGNGEKCRV